MTLGRWLDSRGAGLGAQCRALVKRMPVAIAPGPWAEGRLPQLPQDIIASSTSQLFWFARSWESLAPLPSFPFFEVFLAFRSFGLTFGRWLDGLGTGLGA